MKLLNLSHSEYSARNGYYGGAAGDKDGIVINGEPWICKYPKPTIGMRGANLSPLSLTPISEYLGSHIYAILGYPVHETVLGVRDGFLVVACKDFCDAEERLFEIRTLKNIHITEMRAELGLDLHETGDDHLVDLNELFVHFSHNPELKNVEGIRERFWDQVIIDGLIGNNDRNNGNWGIIVGPKGRRIAPVFDNGASFYPKKSESSIAKALAMSKEDRIKNALNVITPFTLDGEHHLNYGKILSLTEADIPAEEAKVLKDSITRIAKLVTLKMPEIEALFASLPKDSEGLEVLSKNRGDYYLESFKARFERVLLPLSKDINKPKP